ncbi:MAG: aldehyde dehydrogenase family protein [Gracilibacteraceae bacterium]|nr:aldehyde dehydrogenase family protein [Gracilibacteraceae bacterium]
MTTVASAGEKEVDRAVKAARAAWPSWRNTPLAKRCEILTAIFGKIQSRRSISSTPEFSKKPL